MRGHSCCCCERRDEVYPTSFFFLFARKSMLELVVSPSRDFVGSKVQSSNRTGLYLRENLRRELHDLQETKSLY